MSDDEKKAKVTPSAEIEEYTISKVVTDGIAKKLQFSMEESLLMSPPPPSPTDDELFDRTMMSHLEPGKRPPEMKTVELTADILAKSINTVKRATGHFLVIGVNYLPDDCYGIMYLRKEDAEKINGRNKKS